jgi:hypothetical protein
VIGIALLAAGFSAAARVWHLQRHIRSAEIGLAQLDSALAGGIDGISRLLEDTDQLAALRATTLALHSDLLEIQSLARPFLVLTRLMGWVPGAGGDLKAAPDLLEMAYQTTSMALSLTDGLTPIADLVSHGGSGLRSLAPKATEQLLRALPQVASARAAFAKASQSRKEIDAASLSPKVQAVIAKFDGYAPSVALGLDALECLPDLLGAQEPRTYLVLAQNSDELRATGGFISGVGQVRVSRGQITELSFQDSYAVDKLEKPHPLPPDPLRRYMQAGMLVLRDANWWPDFPTSARMAASLYKQDTGQSVDGVIAVDVTTLELLLAVMGPIEVPGYPEPISTGNLHGVLMQYWQAPLLMAPGQSTDWWSHRKDFAADLLVALLQKVMDRSSAEEFVALGRSIGTALRQRDAQVYVDDPATAALLHRARWDGAVQPSSGDFLMVVDSNVGFNKVNPNVEQTIGYDTVLDNFGTATSQLTLTYHHAVNRPTPACIHESRYGDSYADLMERCYWDYLRIYLPIGSELVEVTGSDSPPDVYEEAGCTVIGMGFLLETGQSRTIHLTYRHSVATKNGQYSLLVQKQSGSEPHPLRVRVRLPMGSTVVSMTPAPIAVVNGQAIWQAALDRDAQIDIAFR